MTHIATGRCKSGKRWFWIAARVYGDDVHKCDDPVLYLRRPPRVRWEDTEDLALKAMIEAAVRLGATLDAGAAWPARRSMR